MSDHIDRLLRAADPAPAARLRPLTQPLAELRDEIADTRRTVSVPRRWLSAAVLVAVLVGAAAVIAPHALRGGRAAGGGAAEGRPPAVAASETTTGPTVTPGDRTAEPDTSSGGAGLDPDIPRLLLPAPWRVTPLEEDLTAAYGQLGFTDGDQTVTLHWYPTREGLDDAVAQSDPLPAQVAGHDAYVFDGSRQLPSDEPSPGEVLAFWEDGGTVVEARGRGIVPDGATAFAAILGQLERVDAATLVGALPADAVLPTDRAAIVDRMLSDVPVPDEVDLAGLRGDGRVGAGRYSVGAQVTGAVACAWIERWLTATDADDDRAARRAIRAMGTSHDWAVLEEMETQGAWPDVIREYADAMRTGEPIVGGRELTVRESYASALGCGAVR